MGPCVGWRLFVLWCHHAVVTVTGCPGYVHQSVPVLAHNPAKFGSTRRIFGVFYAGQVIIIIIIVMLYIHIYIYIYIYIIVVQVIRPPTVKHQRGFDVNKSIYKMAEKS